MNNTGLMRRIDDLGRVVIPKEIRRKMGIQEGDPLEIYTEGTMVCFAPYNPTDRIITILESAIEDLSDIVNDEDRKAIRKKFTEIKGLLQK